MEMHVRTSPDILRTMTAVRRTDSMRAFMSAERCRRIRGGRSAVNHCSVQRTKLCVRLHPARRLVVSDRRPFDIRNPTERRINGQDAAYNTPHSDVCAAPRRLRAMERQRRTVHLRRTPDAPVHLGRAEPTVASKQAPSTNAHGASEDSSSPNAIYRADIRREQHRADVRREQHESLVQSLRWRGIAPLLIERNPAQ